MSRQNKVFTARCYKKLKCSP